MFYLIGLGLSDEKDITVRGLEIVKRASRVYLEAYTAILLVDKSRLEEFYGRDVIIADRETVESRSDELLADATDSDVAFLVVGDPFSATTHADLLQRARALSIPTRSIPNASIITAVGSTGLQLYSFGHTLSMPYFTPTWRPSSFYDRLIENVAMGLHTLVLLDIRVKEPDLAALARGKIGVYEPPRFMTVAECAAQMLEVEADKREEVCGPETLAVGVARAGSESEKIVVGTLEQLKGADLGGPLHSVVIVGTKAHEMEGAALRECAIDKEVFDRIWERDFAA